ncbi:MAG TPA: HAD-IIIA family hydrolase [Pseudonocardiaceae bacterium]|nr:HAD-IIIA family hydrolase [Pseudonocardiaceae bacterium]
MRRVILGGVLFDRDGTLIIDVPYNGDPDAVVPLPGARAALDRLREHGVAVGLVSNQSGIGRGLLTTAQVHEVNQRVAHLLGPFAFVAFCPHLPADGCRCRKPAPGMVLDAARALGVAPTTLAVVGDIGADVEAATAAGAQGVLVPNAFTRQEEIARAATVAPDLGTAVELLLPRSATRCSGAA